LPADVFSILIYGITVEVIEILVNENKKEGYYTNEFRAWGLFSRVYFHRIVVSDFMHDKIEFSLNNKAYYKTGFYSITLIIGLYLVKNFIILKSNIIIQF
jgi:hypothetical protein